MSDQSPSNSTWSTSLRRRFANLTGSSTDEAVPESLHLTVNTVCELISNGRRRAVIKELSAVEDGETADLGDMARRIAGVENGVPPEQISQNQRKSVYISLRQNHLPKLDEADVVEWDERGGDIGRGRSVDALAALIGVIEQACVPDDED